MKLIKRSILAATLTISTIGASQSLTPTPAHALSQTEMFIHAVHEDFLLRGASPDEVTLYSAYLTGNSRQAMVSAILNGSEFKNLWVLGASQYYEGGIDPSATSITNALISNGDFVASEVSVISSSTYYAASGGTNTGFLQNLYQHVLLRAADPGGLSFWLARLNAGTWTRAAVANDFIRSNESATRRVSGTAGQTSCSATTIEDATSLAAGSYCIVLDRLSDPSGASYWIGQLSGSDQLPSIWAAHAGSNEYWANVLGRSFPY